MEFAVVVCHTFLLVMGLNFLEMTTSIVVQSLGNVKKATMVSFIRQIILFIPLACILSMTFHKGLIGILEAGPIADTITFIIAIFVFESEYKKLSKAIAKESTSEQPKLKSNYQGPKVIITVAREYGSGGRYVGKILAKNLGLNFYDKELITLASKKSGLSKDYISQSDEQLKSAKYQDNNDDRLFIAEAKVIKDLAKNSCVIVGRCADYILKDNKDTIKVFLYSTPDAKTKRATKYYGLSKDIALKTINKINKERAKHYKYYTNRDWQDYTNYDLVLNTDILGVKGSAKLIEDFVKNKNNNI